MEPSESISTLLSTTGRLLGGFGPIGLTAVGVDLEVDVDVHQLIPDPVFIPDFASWDQMTLEQAQNANESTRQKLSNGALSPGCHVYFERRNELSNVNEDAFRTVRRVQPSPGKQQARLGSSYEFFRCLEKLTMYWDDPTRTFSAPPSPELVVDDAETRESFEKSSKFSTKTAYEAQATFGRLQAGHEMPAILRHSVVAAFVKLIAYDFGCNVSPPRTEPRLQMRSPRRQQPSSRKSFFPSRCQFVFQNPLTREAFRNGSVYGPVAVVCCRPDTCFMKPSLEAAQSMDLAREIIAALIAAQHRSREGKQERRFGRNKWWSTAPRWGGGSSGPIGREVENDDIAGDKDIPPEDAEEAPAQPRPVKKVRRNRAIYDNYRMVRPPAATWDRKAIYMSIGKQTGTNYDDVFLVSSLFHHISILRVRVPIRLLEVLDGAPEPDISRRSWGKVPTWRTRWYDLFDANDRVESMRLIWSVMAYQMREITGGVQT